MPPSKNISFEELSQYFHLPINAVAKELGVCATILKKTCRKNGIPRWPHRKIKSIDNRIANLQVNLEKNPQDRDEIAKEIELLKSKKQEIMRNPDILVKSSKGIDASPPSPPSISEPPSKQNSTHHAVKQHSITQARSAPYTVKTFRVKDDNSGSDASPPDEASSVTSTPQSNPTPAPAPTTAARTTESQTPPNPYGTGMSPFFNPQALYREMMEDPIMSGLNFMSNPAANRYTEHANQIALERIMKNHATKMANQYMNTNEYDMPPNQNPYIASPSSLFSDGPASFIQPPSPLYNYGIPPWQQQQPQPMRTQYPAYNSSSINALYQQIMSSREPYFPPMDLPPQQPPRQQQPANDNSEKLSLSEYVTLARAQALFANRDEILNRVTSYP